MKCLGREKNVINCNDRYKYIVHQVSLCFLFLQWFLANLSYQEALSDTQVAIVNILSSTSGKKFVFKTYIRNQDLFLIHIFKYTHFYLVINYYICSNVHQCIVTVFIVLCHSLVLFTFLQLQYFLYNNKSFIGWLFVIIVVLSFTYSSYRPFSRPLG